jgi:hypothetical protein
MKSPECAIEVKMNKFGKVILGMLLFSVLLISCGGQPPTAAPTQDINALLTQSIGTLSASFFLTQTAVVPTATNTPLPTPSPLATSTPLALPSPLPSATQGFIYVAPSVTVTGTVYTPTTNPSSLAYGCNNLGFIRDVTIDSGTDMAPGEKFTKTWQVANTGTCDWLSGYRLVPVSGTNFAEDPVKINNAPVPPNEWRQISVNMYAPKNEGTYTQYWQMSDGAGHTFGSLLGVTIKVTSSYP